MNKVNSIAFRLWIGINLLLLFGTICFSGVYIWKETKSIEQAFKNEAITVVTTMNSVIGTYMLQQNYDEITPFANALLERPYVQYVLVRDNQGNIVNVKGNTFFEKPLLIENVPLIYFQTKIGEVEVGLSTDTILMQQSELIRYMIALFIVISLLAIVLSTVLSSKLSAPIYSLVQATKDMASGKRNIKVNENGPIEMQELAISFNKMAATIEDQENKLRSEIEKATWSLSEKIRILETIQKISHSVINNNYTHDEAILEILTGLKETIQCDHVSIVTWKLNENEEVSIYRTEENHNNIHESLNKSFFSYDELTLLDGAVCLGDQYISRYPWIKIPVKSLLLLPLNAQSKNIGLLCLGSKQHAFFSDSFLDQYSIIYEQVALALDMVDRNN